MHGHADPCVSGLPQGKRYSMPNARIMIHQPLGGASGQAVDIEIQAREIMYHKRNLNQIMADYTGNPYEKVSDLGPSYIAFTLIAKSNLSSSCFKTVGSACAVVLQGSCHMQCISLQ